MNQQEILKKIGGIITELKDQYSYLEAPGNEFNELELELFMANAHFLTDHIEILKKIYGQPKPTALPPATPVFTAEKVYAERQEIPNYFKEETLQLLAEESTPEKIETNQTVDIAKQQPPEKPAAETTRPEVIVLPETIRQEEVNNVPVIEDASFTVQKMEEPEEIIAETEVVSPEPIIEPEIVQIKPEIIPQPETQTQPINFVTEIQPEIVKQELVKPETEPVLTLNQRIAAQKGLEKTVEALHTSTKSVQDLPSLISLNDKLLFVKELFNGYSLAYSEAINILNRYTSFEQAEHFLNLNYAVKNNWKDKPATAERFYEVLRKRFGSGNS